MQTIIIVKAGRVLAAKNGPAGPKFTPDQIFHDRALPRVKHARLPNAMREK